MCLSKDTGEECNSAHSIVNHDGGGEGDSANHDVNPGPSNGTFTGDPIYHMAADKPNHYICFYFEMRSLFTYAKYSMRCHPDADTVYCSLLKPN